MQIAILNISATNLLPIQKWLFCSTEIMGIEGNSASLQAERAIGRIIDTIKAHNIKYHSIRERIKTARDDFKSTLPDPQVLKDAENKIKEQNQRYVVKITADIVALRQSLNNMAKFPEVVKTIKEQIKILEAQKENITSNKFLLPNNNIMSSDDRKRAICKFEEDYIKANTTAEEKEIIKVGVLQIPTYTVTIDTSEFAISSYIKQVESLIPSSKGHENV